MHHLTRRRQFLRAAAQGAKVVRPGVLVQCVLRADPQDVRVGFTATKKIGGAVTRNRAKRRLRAAVQQVVVGAVSHAPLDFVFVARPDTATREFTQLLGDVRGAVRQAHTQVTSPQGSKHSTKQSSHPAINSARTCL